MNTTCELTIILSLSVTFSVTFVSLLPCYIFHSKIVPATSTIRPKRVFVLQGSAAEKSQYGGRFYSTLWRRYLLSDMLKIIKIWCLVKGYRNGDQHRPMLGLGKDLCFLV